MIRDSDSLMSPLIGTFYQCLCIADTIHIAHLGVTVKLHTLLRTGIHSCASKIGDFLDTCNISNSKLTVKTVNGGNSLQLQECAFFYTFRHFRNLLVTQKHLHNNTVRKIGHREDQDRFLISDLTSFHIHNLTSDDNLTHLTGNALQRNRFSIKISAVNHIRIAVPAESEVAAEIPLLNLLLFFVNGFLLVCLFAPLISRGFLCLFPGCILLLRFAFLIPAEFGMLQDIFHFLFDLKCSIFPVFTLFHFHKIQFHFQIHTAAFTENLMKIFNKYFAFLSGNNRIRKLHTQGIFSCKNDF